MSVPMQTAAEGASTKYRSERTIAGYRADFMKSYLQKAIRRGNKEEALKAAA